MKFRYLGNKETMTAFGYDFSNGVTVDVHDMNAISKLTSNSHFEQLEINETEFNPVGIKEPKKRGRKPRGKK